MILILDIWNLNLNFKCEIFWIFLEKLSMFRFSVIPYRMIHVKGYMHNLVIAQVIFNHSLMVSVTRVFIRTGKHI